MAKLNQRQLLFCEHVLSGVKPAKAIVLAGSRSKQPAREAVELMKNPNVSEYLAEKRAKLQADGQRSREKLADFLWRVIEVDGESIDRKKDSDLINGVRQKEHGVDILIPDKLAAAAQLTKLLGWNAPEKQEGTIEIVIRKL